MDLVKTNLDVQNLWVSAGKMIYKWWIFQIDLHLQVDKLTQQIKGVMMEALFLMLTSWIEASEMMMIMVKHHILWSQSPNSVVLDPSFSLYTVSTVACEIPNFHWVHQGNNVYDLNHVKSPYLIGWIQWLSHIVPMFHALSVKNPSFWVSDDVFAGLV